MEKKISTKTSLLLAALVLMTLLVAYLGTTFAWFTDSASSHRNNVIAGKLDVALNYYDSAAGKYKDASEAVLFDEDALWEPGHVEIAYLEIENLGSLSFNYLFAVYPTEEREGYRRDGTTFFLSDYLVYGIFPYDVEEKGKIATRDEALTLLMGSDLGLTEQNFQYGTMTPTTDAVRLALIVYMPTYVTSAQANHDSESGRLAPSLRLAVDVYATQSTVERDSFSNLYDAGLSPVWPKPIFRFAPEGITVDNENKTITVNSVEALKYIGEIYDDMLHHPIYNPAEWEIVLGCDLDFGGEVLTEPIAFGGFKGFNGNNKTITNVVLNYIYVDEQFESVGLFDELPSTRDLTLEHITVTSEHTPAGALAGKLTGESYSGITISDASIHGYGFIGGMIGWGNFLHPIDFSGIQILRTDLSLFGDGGSAGGIGGYVGTGKVTVSNSTVDGLSGTGVGDGAYLGGMFGEVDSELLVSQSTITEITIYRDVYIGAVTGKIYSTRDVHLESNSISVVVDKNGERTVIPFTASGDVTDADTEIDWDEVQSITNKLKITYGGHFYEVFVTASDITWLAAKESCESKFGHLVTITDAKENQAVSTIVNQFAGSAWLGAYRPVCYGSHTGPHTFVWVTGEEWVYSNWASNEPNDSHPHEGGCENCLHMYSSGQWNDYQNDHSNMRGYVCEWDSLQSYLNYLTAQSK